MYITTLRQLEKLPFSSHILSFAELYDRPGNKWAFKAMVQDIGDEDLYHVEFDDPLSPQKRLTFDLSMGDGGLSFSKVREV